MATRQNGPQAPQTVGGTVPPTQPAQAQARPSEASGGGLVVQAGGALALPADVMSELAQHAQNAAAQERPSVSTISLKAGQMSYAGQPVPGNKLDVIVVASVYENHWYEGDYNPNKIVSPDCFAISLTDAGMAPHENSLQPQCEQCADCPLAEWGSDPKGGRGKACKETRKLAMIPVSALEGDPEDILKAEMATMKLPVTSVKNWATYINQISAAYRLPPFAVLTRVSTAPDARTQFKVNFEFIGAVQSVEQIRAIQRKIEEAHRLLLTPYDKKKEEDEEEAAPTTKKSKKF